MAFTIKKNSQMNAYSDTASSILLLATVIEKVLVIAAIPLMLSFSLASVSESKFDVDMSMRIILCTSASQTAF